MTRPDSREHPRLLPEVTVPEGPKVVTVGTRHYGVPRTAGVSMAAGGALCYVLFRSKLHCLSQSGEIEMPVRIRGTLASYHFGGDSRAP